MRWMGVLAAAAVLLAGCEKKQAAVREKTTRVHTGNLEKRVFQQRIPLQGTVQPVEFATISAKTGGTVEKLCSEGSQLKKGDLLFEIDREVLEKQLAVKADAVSIAEKNLDNAKIALSVAEISLTQAEKDYKRASGLLKNKAVSESSKETAETAFLKAKVGVDEANAKIAEAEAKLHQAHSDLAVTQNNLNDATVKAPFDCVIFETFVEENEYVSTGKEILKLENPAALEVVCYISAVYYDQIVPGKTAVDITGISGTDRTVVSYKAPGIEPESRTFKIKIAVPAQSGLVSGMLCELNIIITEREGYGLPESAVLLRAENKTIAYTVNAEKRAQSVEVKRGITDGGFCEILNAEDFLDKRFVVAGQTFINNGSLLTEAGAEKK